jgi:phosphoglycolate phosphatase
VAEFDTEAAAAAAARAVPVPGCLEAVACLRRTGYRLGVATNDSTSGAEKMLLTLGIAQMFDATYGYDAVANPKPAPDAIIAFADLTGLKPSQLAMVGDNRHDLEMAKAAGAGLAVAVLSGTGTRQSLAPLADVVLGSIAELPTYLAGR